MHNLYQEATFFDLLVEMYEDYYEENPRAKLDMFRNEDGEIEFEETGDELIDKWEKEIAMGLTPDLEEGLSSESRKQLIEERNKAKQGRKVASELDGFTEQYDARYASKMVPRGSAEEKRLLAHMPKLDPKTLLGNG